MQFFVNLWESGRKFRLVNDFRGFWGIVHVELMFPHRPFVHAWYKWRNLSKTHALNLWR